MLKNLKLIPSTEDSYPFQRAASKCNFEAEGYCEDEYFMYGSANVYTEDKNHVPESIFTNAPYVTRFLLRRPVDVSKFSGNVVIEILNASAMMDIDRMWVNSWQYFMRNGDIYIGISSKGHVVQALKKFDPERYADINWDNPMPERKEPAGSAGPFRFLPEYESGLFWDMIVDLAKLLRGDEGNPIAQYPKRHLYLTGWSQSGSYVARIVKSFPSMFDGYLAAGCGMGMAPINAYELPTEGIFSMGGLPKGSIIGAKEPYININTESENRNVNWIGDFDLPDFKFRTYQIPGSSHDSYYSLIEYYKGHLAKDVAKIYGWELTYEGVDGEAMDYPFEPVFSAIFRNLYVWVREGVPAPYAHKIETEIVPPEMADPFGSLLRNCTDAFGNARGGIRTPALDYPTGTYCSYSTKADGSLSPMFGKVIPFAPELIRGLYKNIENYKELVAKGTEELVARGFLLKEDKEMFVQQIVEVAKKRGL